MARKTMTPGEKREQLLADYASICSALTRLGPLREPELEAATGLSEIRVYLACKVMEARGYLERRLDGELRRTQLEAAVLLAIEAFGL